MIHYKSVMITNIFKRDVNVIITNEDEYREYVEKNKYAVENIGKKGQQIRPVYDLDAYEPIDINEFIDDIKVLYPNKEVYYAKREPRNDEKKGMKYSYRVYVDGVKTNSAQIKALLLRNGIDRKWSCLDLSIYDVNKVLLIPLTTSKAQMKKGCMCIHSVPTLEPVDCDIFKCCASYIEVDFEDYTCRNPDTINNEREQETAKIDAIIVEDTKTPIISFTKLMEIIEKLSVDRATEYHTWTRMIWCIINIGKISNLTQMKIYELCKAFSKLSPAYNETDTENFLEKNYDNDKEEQLGWKYLYECLKKDNNEYFESITILTYKERKTRFELTHAKILYPSAMMLYYNNDKWEVQNITKAKDTYAHLMCKNWVVEVKKGVRIGKWVEASFIHLWLKDPKMRLYENIVFKPPPLKYSKKDFNLWRNFDIDTIARNASYEDTEDVPNPNDDNANVPVEDKRDYWAEYKTYIINLLGDEKVALYILARYALRLQKPAIRSNVILIVCGLEGEGKNRMLEPIYKIFGEYTTSLTKSSDLYEKHSQHEYKRLLIRLDEAGGLSNFQNADDLKARATEMFLYVNPKGIQAFTIDNFCDYDMTTNNINVVKLTDESTRRFLQVETTSYYKGNVAFFNDYKKNIECNGDALRQIYDGLMAFDWKAIVPSGNFQDPQYKPLTKITQEIKEQNREKPLMFLEYFIRPYISYDADKVIYKSNKIDIINTEFYNRYKNWCCSINYKDDANAIQFGMKFIRIMKRCDGGFEKTNGRHYIFNLKPLVAFFETIEVSFKPNDVINEIVDDDTIIIDDDSD